MSTFVPGDFALLDRYATPTRWSVVASEDREGIKELRRRLKSLVDELGMAVATRLLTPNIAADLGPAVVDEVETTFRVFEPLMVHLYGSPGPSIGGSRPVIVAIPTSLAATQTNPRGGSTSMVSRTDIPVVRHRQKGVTCYVGHMTAAHARRLTFADHYPPNPEEGRIGYQRLPNPKRAKAFADYLAHSDSGFMTPILLNARQALEFVPSEADSPVGHLSVPDGQRFAKIDGQHRGMGVEQFLGREDFPVPFMLFEQLPEDEEQQLFVAINREQKRVSMSHVLYINEAAEGGDEYTAIALRLNEDDRSPWHRKINVIGATGTGLGVNLQTLQEGLKDYLFAHPKTKLLGEEAKYRIALAFWTAVAETWPDAWAFPKKHQLTKAVGIFGLSKSGSYLVAESLKDGVDADDVIDDAKLRAFMARARSVDWASNGQFAGLGGRGGADRVSDDLDRYFVGGPIA